MKYQHASKLILVVSEDPCVREELGQVLRTADFNVLTAESGRSAEETLAANPVSIIVLDFRTRFDAEDSNLQGARTLSSLTDVDPFLPLILTCDASTRLSHETALMADLVLRHPVQPAALLDGIHTLLRESLRERVYRKSDFIATLR